MMEYNHSKNNKLTNYIFISFMQRFVKNKSGLNRNIECQYGDCPDKWGIDLNDQYLRITKRLLRF